MEIKCLRSVCGVIWRDRVRNDGVRKKNWCFESWLDGPIDIWTPLVWGISSEVVCICCNLRTEADGG